MKGVARLVLVLGLVAMLAGLALAFVHQLTKGPIAEAERLARVKAVRATLPGIDNDPDADKVEVDGTVFYTGTQKGELVGWAFGVRSQEGYAGEIRALVGVSPAGKVTGVRILTHTETPGLGAKFARPEFLAQFTGKGLGDAAWAVKKDGGDFDQITGATITPRALIAAMQTGLQGFETVRPKLVAGSTAGGEADR